VKFSAKVANGPMNERLIFGGDPDHGSGCVSRHCKRRALAEVCTVPVLLVNELFMCLFSLRLYFYRESRDNEVRLMANYHSSDSTARKLSICSVYLRNKD